jgi:uncharacterized protein YifE (UPF0438 family)
MILKMDRDYEIKLSSMAVEKIEETYDKAMDEIFSGAKMRAKDVNFIIASCLVEEIELPEAKKLFAKYFTYTELIEVLNQLLGGSPNEKGAEKVIENE